MTLTQLEYVLAVAKHQHFGRAAEACFVTQPTLSMQIQKLEDELQVILFDRSKSPIQTTPEGMVVVEQGKRVITEQKKIGIMLDQTKEELIGDFKLGVIPTVAPFLIPLFANAFVKKHPCLKLKIEEHQTDDIIELLREDRLDAALLVTPLDEKHIEERVLYYEPFFLFTSLKHQISKKKTIKQKDLDLDEIWLLNKGNCFRDQILNICKQKSNQKLHNPIDFESGNFETLKNMVMEGGGYTLLPYMATFQLTTKQKKMLRSFERPIPTRQVALVYNKQMLKKKVLDSLEEEILYSLPDELAEYEKAGQIIPID